MIGKTLAHYEITSQLGKGGMGEVYQAKDLNLGRDVAIKVLPEEFAKDADRIGRFQREAKLLASLNHPNIAAIYGLEESGGTNFLVLELIEGQTLADQIKSGPIPVEDSLKLALQIAEALEAAHEKGVIHRDLKPANIKVTPDGKVKVLDFGLAKAFAGEQKEMVLSNSPTLSVAATQQGVILGTAAYMPPEQAKGKTVDKKADIWAFGVVVFEMLAGRQLFAGETVSETLASVLKSEPEWKNLPRDLHPRIRLLLERCLEKEPKNRYGAINDARVDIEKALADPAGVLVQPAAGAESKTRLRTILPWVAATAILSIIIAGMAVWRLKPSEPKQVIRFEHELPEGRQFSKTGLPNIAVSPDGSSLVFSTDAGLYLRSLDEASARPVMGADNDAAAPFFSSDGQWIVYCSAGKLLKKISVRGGAPVTLSGDASLNGASWGPGDTIIYVQPAKGIMRVSADGGTPELLVKAGGEIIIAPQMLPDGKSVLFRLYKNTSSRIVVQSLESEERKELFAGDNAKYLPTGHIIYALENSLHAVPFDSDKLEVAGAQVQLVEDVYVPYAPQYDVSESGTLIYVPWVDQAAFDQRTLVWLDQKGGEEPIAAPPYNYVAPRISPDGAKVALSVYASTTAGNARSDIWIWDFAREMMTRLTLNEGSAGPVWTPDGKRIAFASLLEKNNVGVIYWRAANGTGEDEPLASAPDQPYFTPTSWSRDAKTLVTFGMRGDDDYNIGAVSIEGERKLKPLLNEKYNETVPEISPDGKWMAYVSDESGQPEVYVRPFPEVNADRCQVSVKGGMYPLWSKPDGRKIYYCSGDAVMAVSLESEPTFKAGKPEILFRSPNILQLGQGQHGWDISRDGKRFLLTKAVEPAGKSTAAEAPRKINIILNWVEELKRRVPASK